MKLSPLRVALVTAAALIAIAAALPAPTSCCPRTDVASVPPKCVCEPDAGSTATVPIVRGERILDLPRNALGGMAFGPRYCPSGRGICGQVAIPEFALLWPNMTPIPDHRKAEFAIMSPARTPELIRGILLDQEEPERVAKFGSGFHTLEQTDYGLYREKRSSDIFWAYPNTNDRISIYCIVISSKRNEIECSGTKYVLGNVSFVFEFSKSLLPQWAQIDRVFAKLIDDSVRGRRPPVGIDRRNAS